MIKVIPVFFHNLYKSDEVEQADEYSKSIDIWYNKIDSDREKGYIKYSLFFSKRGVILCYTGI